MPGAINYNVEELYFKLLNEKKYGRMKQNYLSQNNFEESKNDCERKEENKGNNGKSYFNKNNEKVADGKNNEKIDENNKLDKKQTKNIVTENENDPKHDVGHDTHKMWEKKSNKRNIEKNEAEEKKENNENEDIEKTEEIDHQTIGKYDLKKDLKEAVKKISETEEINAFVQNTSDKKKNLEELRKSIINNAIGNKKASIGANRNINKIGNSQAIIDWRNLLKEAVNYNVDWSYTNASIENGVLRANLEELKKPETEILLDTSGSISEVLLKNFLKECKNILRTSNVKVGCFDTKFYGFQKIKREEDIEKIRFVGHGGTNYYVATNAFTKVAENKIIFTDGKALVPEKTTNIIWIVFGDTKINVNNGKVIYINNEQLRHLYIA